MSLSIVSLISSNRSRPVTFQYQPYTGNVTSTTNYYIWRSYDGTGNNLNNPTWGSAGVALLRQSAANYADGISSLAVRTPTNPNPRSVSNSVCAEVVETPSVDNLTNMTWLWGQFLDHEIDLTKTNSAETADMTTPFTDVYPGRTIPFERSVAVAGTGVTTPREQPNDISAYIDGTNVYGYSTSRANALRLLDGTGKMLTATADNGEVLLPYNTMGLENAQPSGTDPADFFIAGDIRANENFILTAMHTLFVREHNRLCDLIVVNRPEWSGQDELIFQHARAMVIAMMQQITYSEFLPALLGINTNTQQYNENVNAGIATEFSTVGYRLGHTMVATEVQVGSSPSSTIMVRNAFFTPSYLQTNGIDALLQGTTLSKMNEIDGKIIDDLRNLLFGPPTASILHDLASLNLQRGRDHGIPSYNVVRQAYGLSPVTNFSGFLADSQAGLQAVYTDVNEIDPWVGAIAEKHLPGAQVGELVYAILYDQFSRLRDGDRFWFENDPALTPDERTMIKSTRLSDIILRNTSISSSGLNVDVFHV